MIKPIILLSALTVTALSPVIASAESDSQYPAANFQPKVIFIDDSAAKHQDSDAPAAKSKSSSASKADFDPEHPAAFFQPKVIFP